MKRNNAIGSIPLIANDKITIKSSYWKWIQLVKKGEKIRKKKTRKGMTKQTQAKCNLVVRLNCTNYLTSNKSQVESATLCV